MVFLTADEHSQPTPSDAEDHSVWSHGKRYDDLVDVLVATQQALHERTSREQALEMELKEMSRALKERSTNAEEMRRALTEANDAVVDAEARASAAEDECVELKSKLEDLTERTGLWTVCLACGHHIGHPLGGYPPQLEPELSEEEKARRRRRAEKNARIRRLVAPQDRNSPFVEWL